jgi:uncharacterized protein
VTAIRILTALAVLSAANARADLYGAQQAVDNNDLARAFELYREIAELGQLQAQKALAVMYVNGEGTKRDNVLGYAWAKIALEQGADDSMKNIVDQLEPHVTDAARKRIADLTAKFGHDAIRAGLIPEPGPEKPAEPSCTFARPANPDDFYPQDAIHEGISGEVLVQYDVQPDGRARTARVLEATPPYLFDEAARAVVMNSVFNVEVANGVAQSCTMNIKVKFAILGKTNVDDVSAIKEKLPATRAKAESGDPMAQFLYAIVLSKHSELNTDKNSVIPWLVGAAQSGLMDAQFFIGAHALYGVQMEKNEAIGVAWLRQAARSGQLQAQLMLAHHLVTTRSDVETVREAGSLLESAVKSGYIAARYPLAALLATAPDKSMRDPRRALQYLHDVMPVVTYDPVPHEVFAAACAWLSDYDCAVESEKVAIRRANKLGWDTTPLAARLKRYQANKPWTGNLMAR